MALFSNFKETTITWDAKNWVTVVLMVALGFALLVLLAQGVKKATGGKIDLAPNVGQGSGGPSLAAVA